MTSPLILDGKKLAAQVRLEVAEKPPNSRIFAELHQDLPLFWSAMTPQVRSMCETNDKHVPMPVWPVGCINCPPVPPSKTY